MKKGRGRREQGKAREEEGGKKEARGFRAREDNPTCEQNSKKEGHVKKDNQFLSKLIVYTKTLARLTLHGSNTSVYTRTLPQEGRGPWKMMGQADWQEGNRCQGKRRAEQGEGRVRQCKRSSRVRNALARRLKADFRFAVKKVVVRFI
jgi:hypothetical protein